MKSLSEIETTAKRASRAVGYSWGIAEEIGKSIRLFELFGFPAIKHLNQYFQNKKKENFEEVKLINKINKSNGSSFCPIMLGVNFIDKFYLFKIFFFFILIILIKMLDRWKTK